MLHGMALLVLTSVYEETWPNALAALVVVHPIWPGEGEDDYIAVMLNATMCYTQLCANAQGKGLQFPNGFADDDEDVIDAFKTIKATMKQVNKECAEAASKPNKCVRTKKSDAVVGAHKIRDKTAAIRESSWPKQKILVPVESERHPKKRSLTGNYHLQL